MNILTSIYSRSLDGDADDSSRSGSRRSFRSRADEKQALSEFNDRLANYIEVCLFFIWILAIKDPPIVLESPKPRIGKQSSSSANP
jgi:hypothetical protein